MDNFNEENMEEYDEHITVMEVDSIEGCKSFLFTGYRDISETNDQNDSFPYSLDNEPRIGVKKHEINIPEQQNTVSDDLEHDSEIEIYDEMGQTEKNIVSAATKNTKLYTRQTEENSLNVKTFFIPKNNTPSNPLVKTNQIEIPSTAIVNMPKSTSTTHLQPKSSINTEIGHNKSFLKNNQHKMFRSDHSNVSRIRKYILCTVKSKGVIKNNSNTIVQNDKIKINTNCPEKLNASSSQLSSNSEYLKQSDSSSLSYGQVQWEDGNGKITKNDNSTFQLLQLGSFTELNSYKMEKNGANDSNGSGDIIKNLNIQRTVKEHFNMNKVSEEIINFKDDSTNKFISCKYEYCDTLVYEVELIDDLYCSLECKHLDVKQIVTEDKNVIDKSKSLSKKSAVDLKHCSKILEKRISKRKQRLTTYCSEEMDKVNDDFDEQLNHVFNKPSIEKMQSPLKPLLPIISPESIDDDDDDEYFDLKPLIEDTDVLEYMIQFQNNSAPKKLFDRPFPTEKNCFIVGQKLEGIDPKHVALFCVMTVSEVCGYRIKLNFDGFENDYDFWVNADCPDLFYPGWCELNSRILQPPNDYGKTFDWIAYLRECQAFPAPKHNFVSTKHINSFKSQYKFHIGGKLEALDKVTRVLTNQLICVATVVDVLGNRVCIHLDGRTDNSDYWVDISSNNIHPVRWCDNNGKMLIPPKGYNNILSSYKDSHETKTFNWTEYLKETNSEPVPEDAFVLRSIRDFSNKMIIEVVDIIVPSLLRIARVVDVRNNELKIVYDGFDKEYEYWVEDDSPDIHPVGWSSQTNHPIEVPPATLWRCLVPGCKGYGNSSNSWKMDHDKLKDCPYEIDSWKTAIAELGQMPDRLEIHNVLIISTLASSKTKTNVYHNKNKEKNNINTEYMNCIEIKEKINENRLNFLLDANNIEPECETAIENSLCNDNILSINNKKLYKNIGLSLAGFNSNSVLTDTLRGYWTIHNAQLGIPLFNTTDASTWSVHEVALYVKKVVANYKSDRKTNQDSSISDSFINQEINGETFLMLNQNDLMDTLKIPLGPAIKIFYAITTLRQRTSDYDLFETRLPQH